MINTHTGEHGTPKDSVKIESENPYLLNPKNIMFIQKVEHGSRIVWVGSWLNQFGIPDSYEFSSLKSAKKRAVEMGINFQVSKLVWVSV